MTRDYSFDDTHRIWQRSDKHSISYSDGDDAENYILSTLKYAQDVSSTSPELASAICDWPSEYHLSLARHNLLRFLQLGPAHRVLELGCGCGAITRYLGEAGATVAAVEGSRKRAQIAAERCRDLANVTVYCDNLIDFETFEKFDFVTLIGVLEYAPKFIHSNDPLRACLRHARTFLAEGGRLILAIENKFGLKYFNGCSEDHLGIAYYGINGLYDTHEPATLGRHELARLLDEAGFPAQEFFYPFPDYKLPTLVLSEGALEDSRLNVADLLIHKDGRNYPETSCRAFSESLAWRGATANHLLPDLANSFLVLAGMRKDDCSHSDWLAKLYSRDRRVPCFQLESTIAPDTDTALTVRKRKTFLQSSMVENGWLGHVVADSAYLPGKLLVGRILEAMAREVCLDDLVGCFAPWLDYLLDHTQAGEQSEYLLPGNFIDCLPANLILSSKEEICYIDAEWVSNVPIDLAWVILRGVFSSLSFCFENRRLAGLTYRQLILAIGQSKNIDITDEELDAASVCEERFKAHCLMDGFGRSSYADMLDQPIVGISRLSNAIPHQNPEFNRIRNELTRVKGTVSWRITAPLRVAWNLIRKVATFMAR